MGTVGYIYSYRVKNPDWEVETKLQKDKIRDYCAQNSLELSNFYEEPITSRPENKPVLKKLLNDAKFNSFAELIIVDLDRFGRDEQIKKNILKWFTQNNIKLITINATTAQNTTESAKIQRIKQKVKDIPSLPEVVTKVVKLVQDPNSSALQLGKVISHDPGLTAKVLKLVNSAYYGFPKQISSIQHAITILGFATMRGLVLSSSVVKIFTPKSTGLIALDYKKFWKHSLLSAISSKTVGEFTGHKAEDDIFSAAIMHDIGKIILEQYDHENYIKALKQAPEPLNYKMVLSSEKKHCEVTHGEIGSIVAQSWNLPQSITDVILHHHTPLASTNYKNLTSMVYLGNILSHFAIKEAALDISSIDMSVLNYLGIDSDSLLQIYSDILEKSDNMEGMDEFFE